MRLFSDVGRVFLRFDVMPLTDIGEVENTFNSRSDVSREPSFAVTQLAENHVAVGVEEDLVDWDLQLRDDVRRRFTGFC